MGTLHASFPVFGVYLLGLLQRHTQAWLSNYRILGYILYIEENYKQCGVLHIFLLNTYIII